MKQLHPADTRYRAKCPAKPARSVQTVLSDRAPLDAAIRDPRAERKAAELAAKTAHRETIANAPFWVNLVPFGAQWLELKVENARNAAKGRSVFYTIAQIIGAVLLYFVVMTLAGPSIIQL